MVVSEDEPAGAVTATVEDVMESDARLRCFIWGALTDTSDPTEALIEKMDAVFRWIKAGEKPGPRGQLRAL